MYCDQCGAQLQSGEPRCGRCGKTVLGLIALRRSRVRDHIRLVGILWMAYSSLHVVVGVCALVCRAGNLRPHDPHSKWSAARGYSVAAAADQFLRMADPGKSRRRFLRGWGLLQREDWARTVALVVGFVALLIVPVGTALGIYTLWVLLPSQSDEEYKALSMVA